MRFAVSVIACVLTSSAGNLLYSQHLDWHGDHFDLHQNVPHGHDPAGHLIDRFGHHIDGHGLHTGSVGVFENGSRDYSGRENYWGYPSYRSYSSPSYGLHYRTDPLYSSRYYADPSYRSRLNAPYTSGYYTSGYPNDYYSGAFRSPVIIIAPPSGANTTSLERRAAPVLGGTVVLRNPRTNRGAIRYALNEFQYTMEPGERQTIPVDRAWSIEFHNGLDKKMKYRLEAGQFDFTVSAEAGWDIVKRVEASATTTARDGTAANAVPANEIPE